MMAIGSMVKLPDQESFTIPTETFLKVITKTTKLMEKVPTKRNQVFFTQACGKTTYSMGLVKNHGLKAPNIAAIMLME